VVWLEKGRLRGTGTHQELWDHEDYRAVFTGGE
jgi:ATP-binding cassette subfamily B protein